MDGFAGAALAQGERTYEIQGSGFITDIVLPGTDSSLSEHTPSACVSAAFPAWRQTPPLLAVGLVTHGMLPLPRGCHPRWDRDLVLAHLL